MNVLIVAPDRPELSTTAEIREIQRQHSVKILSGTVTKRDVFQWCRDGKYDILHFAGHGGETGLWLSDGDVLSREDIGSLCRLSGTRAVFFNSCNMIGPATYATRHGAEVAIFPSYELRDDIAWQVPLVFYTMVEGNDTRDIITAFRAAEGGDGNYSIVVAPTFIEQLIQRIRDLTAALAHTEGQLMGQDHSPIAIGQRDALALIAIWLIATVLIFLALSRVG